MQNSNPGLRSPLEAMRRRMGTETFKAKFNQMAQEDPLKAAALLNHEGLHFSTLYILRPVIDQYGLIGELTPRNRIALLLCQCTEAEPVPMSGVRKQYAVDDAFISAVLKWIFRSGIHDDGLDESFDQVLDMSASLLIHTFHENAILPDVVGLIFRRNRRDSYIHDLVWSLFSAGDPRILQRIAVYLRSQNPRDAALARSLLRIETGGGRNPSRSPEGSYLRWFRENRPYLYFTGQGFHQTSDPVPCRVNLEAKYLGRTVSPRDGRPSQPLTESESGRLNAFHQITDRDKALIANYSHRLSISDKQRWSRWMSLPIERQITIARGRSGGTV